MDRLISVGALNSTIIGEMTMIVLGDIIKADVQISNYNIYGNVICNECGYKDDKTVCSDNICSFKLATNTAIVEYSNTKLTLIGVEITVIDGNI